MKKTIAEWLNRLAWAARPDTSGRTVNVVVGALLVLCVSLCAWMSLGSIDRKFVLMIDAIELGGTDSVSIGRGSDISIKGVPHDYLRVARGNDGTMHWHVNSALTDSLQYFKVNNLNPNLQPVLDSEDQTITVALPSRTAQGTDTTVVVSMTGADVWRCWSHFRSQQNVLVRHLAAYHCLAKGNTAQEVSDEASSPLADVLYRQMERRDVQSYFNARHNRFGAISDIRLVVLDSHTTIDGRGYTFHDTATTPPASFTDSTDAACKVQFYTISSNSLAQRGGGSKVFETDGVQYVMKATPRLTEWGAGHVMLKHHDDAMRIVFPKAIGYVGSIDSLRSKARSQSGIVTFRQYGANFPTGADLYLPQFSTAVEQDICTLELGEKCDSIRDNSGRAYKVENATTAHLPFALVPTLRRVTLSSGPHKLDCRVGIIDSSFILSYIWLPLLVTLMLICLVMQPRSPFRIKSAGTDLYSPRQLLHFPAYLAMLLATAMAYCLCKSLIALKLSYTFPYFEKLTGIVHVTTSLMLLVAFTLILLFNPAMMGVPLGRQRLGASQTTRLQHRFWVWTTWGGVVVLFATVVYAFFFILDTDVSAAMIESYFRDEVSFFSKWWSDTAYGVNDNHRTVPYALISVEAVLLLLAAFMIAMPRLFAALWQRTVNLLASVSNVCGTLAQRLTQRLAAMPITHKMQQAWHQFATGVSTSFAKHSRLADRFRQTRLGQWLHRTEIFSLPWHAMCEAVPTMWRVLWPGHIVLLVAIALICPRMGNFGTAFISLVVIVGLSRALTSLRIVDPADANRLVTPPLVVLFAMFFIVGAYSIAAMAADAGYLTNALGFIIATLSFFYVLQRPRATTTRNVDDHRREARWTARLSVIAVIVVLLMPFALSRCTSSDEADYGRTNRRLMLYSNFDHLQQLGYRYTESDAEFMVIMSHYMQQNSLRDPLSNDVHPLHASVSTGQSPVVLNDLSVPAAFFGAYASWRATIVLFCLLLSLLLLVVHFSLSYYPSGGITPRLTRSTQWRLMAVFMWAGTTFYIFFSYIDCLPFTGRLIPGFGVDAVGEALESAILLAFMGTVTIFPAATITAAVPKAIKPAATKPAVTKPAAAEPAATEPATAEPAATEPIFAEPTAPPKKPVAPPVFTDADVAAATAVPKKPTAPPVFTDDDIAAATAPPKKPTAPPVFTDDDE